MTSFKVTKKTKNYLRDKDNTDNDRHQISPDEDRRIKGYVLP